MTSPSPDPPSPASWKRLLTGQLPLEHETALFVLVNVLDFFMTYWMLLHNSEDGGRPLFSESNPIAAYFLHTWGPFKGMLIFKMCIVGFVCLLTQVIALKKFQTARWVLNLGTAAVSLVVVYSLVIYLRGLGHVGA